MQPLPELSVGAGETSEVVWKGGEPSVLQGLVLVEGKKYVRLTKDRYAALNQLLVPASQRKKLFSKTKLFEHITALRDATASAQLQALIAAGREDDDDVAGDPTASLGFDAPERREPRAQRRKVQRMKLYAARTQLPDTASVSYTPPAGGEPWVFNVVQEVGNASRRSAAIELTSSNLERLRGLLSLEIAGLAAASSPRLGAQ